MNLAMRCTLLGGAALLISAVALAQGMGMHRGGMMGGSGGMMGGSGGMMGPPPSAGENPLPDTAAVVAKGKSVFDANCAVCHGAQGRGDGPAAAGLNPRPADLRGASSAWSDGQIAAQIQNGRGVMPAFRATLDDESIWSVVRYVRRLQKR